MRKALYYLSWAVVWSFVLVLVIGSVAKNGWGPVVLGAVLVSAVYGIITLSDE